MPFKSLFGLLKPNQSSHLNTITVVSGLPRSGTSLMMKMLEAGGIPPLTDNLRTPDEDNPKGYYEFERVKKLNKGDAAWLEDATGKSVKVIATLLPHLPDRYTYRVIFMQRTMSEILASQKKMLINRGLEEDKVSDAEMAQLFKQNLEYVEEWITHQSHITKLDVNFNALLLDPAPHIACINEFLGGILDREKMSQVIDKNLYRQRA
jgi:hypothetical protein